METHKNVRETLIPVFLPCKPIQTKKYIVPRMNQHQNLQVALRNDFLLGFFTKLMTVHNKRRYDEICAFIAEVSSSVCPSRDGLTASSNNSPKVVR